MNEFLGNGVWKSSLHVVKFGFVYAPENLIRRKQQAGSETGKEKVRQLPFRSEQMNGGTHLVM